MIRLGAGITRKGPRRMGCSNADTRPRKTLIKMLREKVRCDHGVQINTLKNFDH